MKSTGVAGLRPRRQVASRGREGPRPGLAARGQWHWSHMESPRDKRAKVDQTPVRVETMGVRAAPVVEGRLRFSEARRAQGASWLVRAMALGHECSEWQNPPLDFPGSCENRAVSAVHRAPSARPWHCQLPAASPGSPAPDGAEARPRGPAGLLRPLPGVPGRARASRTLSSGRLPSRGEAKILALPSRFKDEETCSISAKFVARDVRASLVEIGLALAPSSIFPGTVNRQRE